MSRFPRGAGSARNDDAVSASIVNGVLSQRRTVCHFSPARRTTQKPA